MLNSSNMYSRYCFECECNGEIPIDRRKVERNEHMRMDSSGSGTSMPRGVSSGTKHTKGRR